jgi:Tol biopolymer transport system component
MKSIAVIERNGDVKPLRLPPAPYAYPRISPNGKSIAFEKNDGKESDISIYEISGATAMRRLTFGGGNHFPIWSADSQRIAFQSDREGDRGIFWQRADGTGNAERLTKPEKGVAHIPDSWSADGDRFSFTEVKGQGEERAVWIFSVLEKKATLFAAVPSFWLGSSAFSPDGKWLAYDSNETKGWEIFVQPFPPNGTKYQVTKDGLNHNPAWSPDGKELFYIPGPNRFLKTNVTTTPRFTFSDAVAAPKGGFIEFGPFSPRTYDITRDGKRFVGLVAASQAATAPEIHVVINWFTELQQRVPVK